MLVKYAIHSHHHVAHVAHDTVLYIFVLFTQLYSQSSELNSTRPPPIQGKCLLQPLLFSSSRQKHNFLWLQEKAVHTSAFPAPTWSSWLTVTGSGLCVLALSMLQVSYPSQTRICRLGWASFSQILECNFATVTVRVRQSLSCSDACSLVLTLDLFWMTVIQYCSVNRMLCHSFLSGWSCISFSFLHSEVDLLIIVFQVPCNGNFQIHSFIWGVCLNMFRLF